MQADSSSLPKRRVFLSYGHDEACGDLVERIRTDLKVQGIDAWVDVERIEFGDEWRQAITDGLKTSSHVLAFLSKHSTRKPGVCRQEIAIALGPLKSHVYTVLVEPLNEVTPPLIVSHLQWLDMQQWRTFKAEQPEVYEDMYQKGLAEILRVIERNEPFAGEIEELQRWLKPLDCTSDMIAAEDGFTGREWLLGDIGETHTGGKAEAKAEFAGEIERWRTDGTAHQVFWIAAEPGWGKSAVSARMAHAGRARVMAVHFCKHDQPDRHDAGRVVRSIAFQMATQLGEYRTLLVEEARRGPTLDDKNAKELFQTLLANPLAHVIKGGRGPHDRHVIVLDALDEAVDADGRSELLTLVSSEFGKLPSWLGLLVTSRPEAPVVRQLSQFGVHALKADDPRNLQDVQTYTHNWLQKLDLDVTARKAALEAVLQAGQGNFLYVRQLEAAVKEGILSPDQLTQSAGLPSGLAALYERWFLHRFKDQEAYERVQRPLLELMLAAREPLPLQLAGHVLGWGAYGQGKALKPLGSLCVQTSLAEDKVGTVTFFHKSLRDWLADELAAGPDWHSSEVEGHRLLAERLWQAYKAWESSGLVLDGGDCFETLGFTGQAYALRHLPAHLREIDRRKQSNEILGDVSFALARCDRSNELSICEDYRSLTSLSKKHARACYELIKAGKNFKETDWSQFSNFSWSICSLLVKTYEANKLDDTSLLYVVAAKIWMYEENYISNDKIPDVWIFHYLKKVNNVFSSISSKALDLEEFVLYERFSTSLASGLKHYAL